MEQISKNRLEAFSDGVIAIIITVMVLELRAPQSADLTALKPVLPTFFIYILSFIYLGIYWNNHHHMLHATRQINGRVMWANLHLLFWLSLFPFVTAWIGKTNVAPWPTALYGFVLMMASIAYVILQCSIVELEGKDSALAKAVRGTWKEKVSTACYAMAVGCAFIAPWLSIGLYIFVASLWIVPDRRIERHIR